MLRCATNILFGLLMRIFLDFNMSSSGCPTDDFTEFNLKLESNFSWSEILTLGRGENLFLLFLESRSCQNFRIPERFLAKLTDPVLFICRPYSFRCDSSMFSWWMQSQSVEFSKLINFLLLISELEDVSIKPASYRAVLRFVQPKTAPCYCGKIFCKTAWQI